MGEWGNGEMGEWGNEGMGQTRRDETRRGHERAWHGLIMADGRQSWMLDETLLF